MLTAISGESEKEMKTENNPDKDSTVENEKNCLVETRMGGESGEQMEQQTPVFVEDVPGPRKGVPR